jgi:3-oxoacyl-(acyl-carrier-protein) synthase
MERRVVITGMGTVNPLANDIESTWKKMLEGKSGIGKVTSFNTEDYRCKIGGELKDFELAAFNIDSKMANKMDRSQQIYHCKLSFHPHCLILSHTPKKPTQTKRTVLKLQIFFS